MTLIDFRERQNVEAARQERGRHVVCWGSSGSGKSSLATNLAFEFALAGKRVYLVDADSYHPSIAALLGLIDAGAGISGCLRLCRTNRITVEDVVRLSETIEFDNQRVDVITGMPALSRWPELDADSLHQLSDLLAAHADLVVWDVASYLELSLFGAVSGTQRNEATNTLLEISDLTFGTFLADPVGVNRFLFDCKAISGEIWPVANRVRSSVLGKKPESQMAKVLSEAAGLLPKEFIREDPGFDHMLATGKPLRFQGRNSKALEAIARLAKKATDYLEE